MADTRNKSLQCYLLLDIGGTQIKGALLKQDGTIFKEPKYYQSLSKDSKELIFKNFSAIITELLVEEKEAKLLGIGMAFPGPFDYENGISLMKGLNKYDSIYGISIEKEIKKLIPSLENVPFCFLHDVEAFAIGTSWFGSANKQKKLLCLCIGTGIGSAFVKDHIPLKLKQDGIPYNGWLYNTPYKKSILDEYISVRGLAKLSKKYFDRELSGKELYDLCRQGDEDALKVFSEFGMDLYQGISPFIHSFIPNAVVFGGQISKSFTYFGQLFTQLCQKEKIEIYLEEDTSILTMKGLLMAMKGGETNVKL